MKSIKIVEVLSWDIFGFDFKSEFESGKFNHLDFEDTISVITISNHLPKMNDFKKEAITKFKKFKDYEKMLVCVPSHDDPIYNIDFFNWLKDEYGDKIIIHSNKNGILGIDVIVSSINVDMFNLSEYGYLNHINIDEVVKIHGDEIFDMLPYYLTNTTIKDIIFLTRTGVLTKNEQKFKDLVVKYDKKILFKTINEMGVFRENITNNSNNS